MARQGAEGKETKSKNSAALAPYSLPGMSGGRSVLGKENKMTRKADDAFSSVFLFALVVGLIMFIMSWVHNELPGWMMKLIAATFHASPTGGK